MKNKNDNVIPAKAGIHKENGSPIRSVMTRYNPGSIEAKWQDAWRQAGIYKFNKMVNGTSSMVNKKFYTLVELPYPSGDLHIGHWFTFVAPDVLSRFKRMQGYNVFFPMGYDAFGLPAENAAIKNGVHPKDWTEKNIATMTRQFETMGTMIDWDHVTVTCLPEYYTWNQWIFIKMFEKGIAYRGKTLSNWCPTDQTVLANEHVENGKCWRCGDTVVQKEVEQWFLRITDYAERLLWPSYAEASDGKPEQAAKGEEHSAKSKNFDSKLNAQSSTQAKLDWPKSVMAAQNEWIGKKEGIEITYPIVIASEAKQSNTEIATDSSSPRNDALTVTVFTGRPDTNFGATFIAIAPEHPLVKRITAPQHEKEVQAYVKAATGKTELERKEEGKEKTGVFTGAYAINQLTGYKMPIWVSDFVLINFGTGALVGVPGHDLRDFDFAYKYNLDIKRVVVGSDKDESPITKREQVQEEEGTMINSDFLNGLDIHDATTKIMDYLVEKGWGKKITMYHLHDWSVSRQRYWGTPVPFIYCSNCYNNRHPEHSEGSKPNVTSRSKATRDLPIEEISHSVRNDHERYGFDYTEINGKKYAIIPVPLDQLPVTLPYDVDYQPKGKAPLASNASWMNVKCPKCGGPAKRDPETLDTFFDSAWYYYRYVDPGYTNGPFDPKEVAKLMPVDIYFGGGEHTLGHTLYARFFTKFFKDLGMVDFDEFALKRVQHGIVLGPDGNKMSKSKGNVINPDDVVREFGTDAVRVYLSFMMPYQATGSWSTTAMYGMFRFLKRVWELQSRVMSYESVVHSKSSINDEPTNQLTSQDLYHMHSTIKKVTEDIEAAKNNTAVAALMKWLNYLEAKEEMAEEEYKNLLLILSPFAPHITEELWQSLFMSDESRVMSKKNSYEIGGTSHNSSPITHHQFRSIHQQAWPTYDESLIVSDTVTIAVQINGKLRDTLVIARQSASGGSKSVQSEVEEEAQKSEKIKAHLAGKTIKKVIYVSGKIVNFVV